MEYVTVEAKNNIDFLVAYEKYANQENIQEGPILTNEIGKTTSTSSPSVYKIRKDIFECMRGEVEMKLVDAL